MMRRPRQRSDLVDLCNRDFALGSAGAASKGTYSRYSTYGALSYAMTRPFTTYNSLQDRLDFRQFMSSVSSYGASVRCRPGNPYC
jgi:hypothetical protein